MDVGNDRFVDLLLYIFLSAAFRQRQKQEFGTMLVNQKPATRAVFLLLTRIASNAREFWFTTNAHAHRLRGLEKRPMRKAVTVKRWNNCYVINAYTKKCAGLKSQMRGNVMTLLTKPS